MSAARPKSVPTPYLQPRHESALVAGGSRGLGLLVARELAERGYRVQVCARDAEELERGKVQLARDGLSIGTTVVDVSDSAAVQAWVDSVQDAAAPLTVAIHVAGIIQVGPIGAVTPQMFDECIDIMAKGPSYFALAVVPGMRERGYGRIGIVSSIGGVIGVPHLVPYSTAKFAAAGLGQGLHAELAGTGVRVTTILPPPLRAGSHLHAQYSGDRAREYRWFAAGATVPGISLRIDAAARRVVDATLRGRAITGLSPVSQVLLRGQGLAPTLTVHALGLVARLLPEDQAGALAAGRDVKRQRRAPLTDLLTRVGDRVARRTNESHPASTDPD